MAEDFGFYDANFYGGYDDYWNFDPIAYDFPDPGNYPYYEPPPAFNYAPTFADVGSVDASYYLNNLPAIEAAAAGGGGGGGIPEGIMPYAARYEEGPMTVAGSPRLYTPELTSMEDRLSSVGKVAPVEAPWYKSALDNAINAGKNNPFAALALLGSGAAAIGGLSQSGAGKVTVPSRTTALTPQEQALVTRGTAPLRDSPAALKKYDELRTALANRARQELGPGYEYSTPYMEAKKRLEEQIDADMYGREAGDRTAALSGLGAITGIGTQQQQLALQADMANRAAAAQSQQNLFGLSGTLGGLGTLGMMYGNDPRRYATPTR